MKRRLPTWPVLLVLISSCGQNFTLGVYEGQINEGTAAIASAKSDGEKAAGYDQRARGYAEKARYLRFFKKTSPEEYARLFDQATRDHAEALRLDPNDADRFASRGVTYYERAYAGPPDNPLPKEEADKYGALARADFSKAIELDPRHEMALDRRGLIEEQERDYDAAIRDYTAERAVNERAGKLRLAQAYCERADTLRGQKRNEAAIEDYKRSIELDVAPDGCTCDPYGSLARAYYEAARYDEAWAAVHDAQVKRRWLPPELIEELKKASGRSG